MSCIVVIFFLRQKKAPAITKKLKQIYCLLNNAPSYYLISEKLQSNSIENLTEENVLILIDMKNYDFFFPFENAERYYWKKFCL